ncbi:hypothetical protein [Bradyrhizobium sp. LMG 9283]|uniref:hypothetical protein n=1 Tax=Bradyrhizobium sp. LMG 9283 TaxID=592064 RepID=UPI003891198B
MNTRVRAENPAAVLQERLDALVTQLVELEKLRERVGREENRQRKLRRAGSPPSRVPICERPFQLRTGKAHARAACSQ